MDHSPTRPMDQTSTQPTYSMDQSPTHSMDHSPTDNSFDVSVLINPTNPINESDIQQNGRNDTVLDDEPVTYEIVEKGSKQRAKKLVSNDGYAYTVKKTTQYATYWRCSVRSSTLWCRASVTQRGTTFTPGPNAHDHPADPGLRTKTMVYTTVLDTASTDPYRPAGNIVDQEMRDKMTTHDFNLPNPLNLIRAANRLRQKMRPTEPSDLTFDIDHSYLEDENFFRGDLRVDTARHIIYASKTQLDLLETARQWYLDGTFKIIHKPFPQLFTIHAFIQKESCMKQVPLLFVMMSRRQKKDYDKVFQHIRSPLPNARVQSFTLDFEAATWRSIQEVFPEADIRGCSFHWGQAVMRKVANLGLKTTYNQRKTTYHSIRQLLSLPYLPADHIVPAFNSLKMSATTQPLKDLMTYLENTWLSSSVWSVRQWSVFRLPVRTNNDTEGWHRRFASRTGATNLQFYRLVPELKKEAETVSIAAQLVDEQQLTRYQRDTYRRQQGQLFDLWDRYEDRAIKTSAFLTAVGKIFR
ncbi:hypothetical protein FSP39_017052 [Pinctada imbricata]|uniref:FLYWCH-type domain-containing protein n=1 Tax=Pinctada imbricata TaxID=66713 RepID=A0AA89BM74_PINIB|nr:hypothetical protein FSP39_017052 [Pinctada imbricata]